MTTRWQPQPALTVEFDPAPLALDVRDPRFSWVIPPKGRGQVQSAYHILVATAPERLRPGKADMWDSGKVASRQSVNVRYAGRALESNREYCWKVRFADAVEKWGAWSRTARFSTALLQADDWKAKWISRAEPDEPRLEDMDGFSPKLFESIEPEKRVPLFRKEFSLTKPVRRARVFVCGLGLYELRLNGQRAGNIVMAPARTEFRKRLFYNTYDVTPELRKGKNAVGILGQAVNEMLIQSYNGRIRVFPAVPEDWPAAFTLRAVGGFLVTSERAAGQEPEYVLVKSLLGNECTVVNPWPGRDIAVQEVSGEPRPVKNVKTENGAVSFATARDATYLLTIAGKQAAGVTVFTGSRNSQPKQYQEAILGKHRDF